MRKYVLLALSALLVTTAFSQQTTSMGFLFFSGKTDGVNADLVWETIRELTVSHFNVQRSTDGTTFKTISRFTAKGDTSSASKNTYAFTDGAAVTTSETVFYRLECVDISGNPYFSKVLQFQFKRSKNMVILSSDKISQTLRIEVTFPIKQCAGFIVTNANGSVVSQQFITCEKGLLRKDMDVSRLPAGMYTVLVAGAGIFLSGHFLKQ